MNAFDYPIHNFAQIKELAIALKAISAQILHYEYSHESFGSWFLTVRRDGKMYRVLFDGKDRMYSLEVASDRRNPYLWDRTIWQHPDQLNEIPIQPILMELEAAATT